MIMLIGYLSFESLSFREYPFISSPNLSVRVSYPNASAEIVESSVTNILEDKLSEIEGIDSMVSDSQESMSVIQMNFLSDVSTERTLAAVRDAISMAKPSLPKEVKEPVIERKIKSSGPPFIGVAIESSSLGYGDLTHFTNVNLKNAFRGLKGVASVEMWGQPLTYSITLDPLKMYSYGVNADQVYDAIEKNKSFIPVGKFQDTIPSKLNSELKTIEDYEDLLVKEKDLLTTPPTKNGVFLRSFAKVELTTENKQFRIRINGKPGLCLAIHRTSDSNPLAVSHAVQEQVNNLQKTLPSDIKISVITDQAEFIKTSLHNIQSSIFEALIFVLVIVFIFLGNVRSTLIPLVTIPISLLGAIIFLKLCGYSLNTMTLLAMVLAVGLVVDDAIVVLENISRHIEGKLSPLEAAIKGSKEISFAIIAMTLTLVSVYMPIAFIKGAVGQLFIEFAVALAGSVLISGVVALTLSPLMCSIALKKTSPSNEGFFQKFFHKLSNRYEKNLILCLDKKYLLLSFGVICCIVSYLLFNLLPSEIAPKEDRNMIGVYIPPITGRDMNEMEEKAIRVENILQNIKEAKSMISFLGDWGGTVVLPLSPLNERNRSADSIVQSIRQETSSMPSVDSWPWSWDSGLPGLDNVIGGNELELVLSSPDTYHNIFEKAEALRKEIENKKIFESIRHDLKLNTQGYNINLNTNLMSKLKINHRQVGKMIEVFFSNDKSLTFEKDGIYYPITLKGERSPWTLDELYITNPDGKRISLGTIATIVPIAQPDKLSHYNQMRSVTLTADLFPKEKLESNMPKLFSIAEKNLPKTFRKNWTGAAKAYLESSATMFTLMFLAVLFIYAILCVQFENFIDPFIILFTIPLACSGALLLTWILGQSLNVYTQVGLITLIGLITKHGILMVDFANQLRSQKLSIRDSILQASHLRLRPILMTTGAMICSAAPLILFINSGYEARKAIGIVLIGGLGFGTLFTLFILPVLYYIIKSATEKTT